MTLFSPDAGQAASPDTVVDRLGQGPARYMRAAVGIARLDTEVMVVVSRDPVAIWYGIAVMVAASVTAVFLRVVVTQSLVAAILTLMFVPVFSLAVSAFSTAVMHGAAKVIFGATGTYVGLLRVLWLGSLVNALAFIPVVGQLVASLWALLIMMVTFQEVDGIERIQALALSLGLSAAVYFIGLLLYQALQFQAS